MEQLFSELEQFGLTIKKNEELEINHKYLIIGFKKIRTNEKNLINLSQKIETYLSPKDLSKTIKKVSKKVQSTKQPANKKVTKIYRIDESSSSVNTFSYVKYIGVYQGKTKIYRNNFYYGTKQGKCYYASDEDVEEEEEEEYDYNSLKIEKNEKKHYEYDIGDDIFTKNNEFHILDKSDLSDRLFLFEVDDSFNDVNFLNIILMIFSNIDSERNKFITVTCSNKDITIESTYGNIPDNYDKTLEYDKNKKYSLDTDFVFFK